MATLRFARLFAFRSSPRRKISLPLLLTALAVLILGLLVMSPSPAAAAEKGSRGNNGRALGHDKSGGPKKEKHTAPPGRSARDGGASDSTVQISTALFIEKKSGSSGADDAPGVRSDTASVAGSGEGPEGKFECDPTHGSDTGHGANTDGPDNPYHNTCEPEHEPGAGLGGGAATGQPCAGCVGNADDKNPPGQAPGGSDANAGYECDRNQGVGKENPAHTGCEEQQAEKPPPEQPGKPPPPPPEAPAAPPEGPPRVFPKGPFPEVRVPAPEVMPRRPLGQLPVTGAGTGVLLQVALLLIAAGFSLLLAARRRCG